MKTLALAALSLFYFVSVQLIAASSPIEVSLSTPFQYTVEDNGITTVKPLLIMPCKGAVIPSDTGDGDAYLTFKNISGKSVELSLRDPCVATLSFFSPCGTAKGNKWRPLTYTVQWAMPKAPGQYLFTLRPGAIRVAPLNLFKITKLVDQPLDWMTVYSTSRVLIRCTLRLMNPDDSEKPLEVSSGWLPVEVHNPSSGEPADVPEGATVEAKPSSKDGYPPTFVVHPQSK